MKQLDNLLAKISKFLSDLAVWLILALILIICYDVLARYFFNSPVEWIFEMSYILGAFIAAFGVSQLVIDGGNVRVDMFFVKFSRKTQLLIDIIFSAIVFIPGYFMVVLATIKNAIYAFESKEVSVATTWYPLLWPIKFVICVGLIMFIIQFVVILIKNIIELREIIKGGEAKC